MTKFSNKFKKPCFWPIFPIFGAKKIFLENPALSRTTSYGFLAPCQNLEKVNDTIQRKHPERRTEGWTKGQKDGRKDGQTLFYRTLLATAGGPISYKLSTWNLIIIEMEFIMTTRGAWQILKDNIYITRTKQEIAVILIGNVWKEGVTMGIELELLLISTKFF